MGVVEGTALPTVVDHLVLCDSVFVAVEDCPEGIGNLGDDDLARGLELGQVIGLLNQRIQGSNLEVGDVKGDDVAVVWGNGAAQGIEGAALVVGVEAAQGQREEGVFCRHVGERAVVQDRSRIHGLGFGRWRRNVRIEELLGGACR